MIHARFRWPQLALLPIALVLCADLDDDDWGHGGSSHHSDSEGCGHRKSSDAPKPPPPPPPLPPPTVTRTACTATIEGYAPHDLTCTWTRTVTSAIYVQYELAAEDRWLVEGGEVDLDAKVYLGLSGGTDLQPQQDHAYSWNRPPDEIDGWVIFYPPHPPADGHPPVVAPFASSSYNGDDVIDFATLLLTDVSVPHGRLFGALGVYSTPGAQVPDGTADFKVEF